jgi:alpha/beta superfamily hydrolase
VYLHTYSGNKCEGKFLFQYLPAHFDLALFDFPGCGNSKGEYITYGITEKYDVDSVLRKLEAEAEYKEFYLWGRSMGAAVVIQYADLFLRDKQTVNDSGKKQKKGKKDKKKKQKNGFRKESKEIPEKIQRQLENAEDSNRVIQKSWKDKVKYLIIDSSFTNLFEMLQGT